MAIVKRGPGRVDNRVRRARFRPLGLALENRQLLAAIDLINIAGSAVTGSPGPYGVLEAGLNGNGGAGYSVAELGDVNGDGFDDFLIGAPSVQSSSSTPLLGLSSGNVFLVFGSAQVNGTTVNWLTLTPQQRVGDLGQLGNANQTNPTNGSTGFAYNGITFQASQNPNNLLGASVAAVGDINGDGFADFMIGAPNALDSTGLFPGAGRGYLVYGGTALSIRTNKQVDLDNNTGANADLNIITFVNSQLGAATGFSVAGVGDVITDGLNDIAIGAPNASFNGQSGNGGVYVISGAFLRPGRTQTVNLANVGQAGANLVPGMILAGAATGDQAGFSVAGAGNFNNDRTTSGQNIPDIIIGAPQTNTGSGAAYILYGSPTIAAQGIITQGVNNISLGRVLPGASNPLPGVAFTGQNPGDQTGFSVSTAGDFNADGVSDVLIGSPYFNGPNGIDSGRVNMVYGRSASPNPPGSITGQFALSNLPSNILSVQFNGAGPNAQTGFSVSAVGRINNDAINEILFGAPGFNNTQGIVYLIPGNPDLIGVQNLQNAQNSPVFGTLITLSQPQSQNFLGTSVSGNLFVNSSNQTMDSDIVADFIIGASGFNLTGSRAFAGGGFGLEGAFIPLANIVSTAITSPIAVETFPSAAVINPTTPDDLTLFVLSRNSNTSGFAPFADLDPNTIAVNNILLPDPGTWTDAGDLDGDGIDDASFVFSPRSLLNLPANSTVTITITGRTLATSPFPNRRYSGSINVRTSGSAPTPPSPGIILAFGPQFENLNLAAPRFGERFLPQLQVIARPQWKPIQPTLAYRQFLPQGNYGLRQRNFFHPSPQSKQHKGPTITLGRNVFTRGQFPKGVHFGRVKYKTPVIGAGLS